MADKEEVRARSDIVEVVGGYVPLRRRGRGFVALCPFHQEKTASFNVDPVTQTFRCFGCGAGGDVFTFVERFENMSFVEAAELLARRAGLEFEARGAAGRIPLGEREQLYRINGVAAEWFTRMLGRTSAAQEYVKQRGLSHDMVRDFALGYAPEGWDNLSGFLESRREDMGAAEKAGLIKPGQSGGHFDMFRHRLVFPIHDEQARVVGFGGRAFGDEQPKYLNTGETPLFTKSKLLFGLHLARRKIGAEGVTLLMEGYMDVIVAHQYGFTNAVATLGTSLTDDHARKLARLAPIVVLVYDADRAGIKATLRASEVLEAEGVQVRVARLPQGEDPDSLLRRQGAAGLQRALDSAVGRVEYQLERVVTETDQSAADGRALLLRRIVAVLASVPTASERDAYIAQVWQHHPLAATNPGMAAEQLHRDAEAYARRTGPGRSAPPAGGQRRQPERHAAPQEGPPADAASSPEALADRELTRALFDPELRAEALSRTDPADLVTDLARSLHTFLQGRSDLLRADEGAVLDALSASGDEALCAEARSRLQEFHALLMNQPLSVAVVKECVARLKQHRIRRVTEELGRLLQSKAELSGEDAERVREHQRLLLQLKGQAGTLP